MKNRKATYTINIYDNGTFDIDFDGEENTDVSSDIVAAAFQAFAMGGERLGIDKNEMEEMMQHGIKVAIEWAYDGNEGMLS